VVWAQFLPQGALHVLGGVTGVSMFIEDFCPIALQYRARWFPRPMEVQSTGDPAGQSFSPHGVATSAIDVLKKYGVQAHTRPAANRVDQRDVAIQSIAGYMRRLTATGAAFGVAPRFVVVTGTGTSSPSVLVDGFEAGYVWAESQATGQYPPAVEGRLLRPRPKLPRIHRPGVWADGGAQTQTRHVPAASRVPGTRQLDGVGEGQQEGAVRPVSVDWDLLGCLGKQCFARQPCRETAVRCDSGKTAGALRNRSTVRAGRAAALPSACFAQPAKAFAVISPEPHVAVGGRSAAAAPCRSDATRTAVSRPVRPIDWPLSKDLPTGAGGIGRTSWNNRLDSNLQLSHRVALSRERTSSLADKLKANPHWLWRRCPMVLFIVGLVVGANLAVLFLSLCLAAPDGPVTALRHKAKAQDLAQPLRDHAA
jgi:hypothetical protein